MAIVVCLLVAVTAAGSFARKPMLPVVTLTTTVNRVSESQLVEPPLLRIGGRLDQRDAQRTVFAISADLLALPCPNRRYRLRVSVSFGSTYTTYDALLVLRKRTSSRLDCRGPLAERYGPKVKLRIYDKRDPDRGIVVSGTREGQTRIVGTLRITAILCRSSRLRATLGSSGRRLSVRYDIAFERVLVNGRPC